MTFQSRLFLSALFLNALLASTEPAHAAQAYAAPSAAAPAAPAGNVYLIARLKLTDTDLTQVVFFQHSAITTLSACEAERSVGLTTGWRYFNRYFLKTFKGFSYQVDYRCAATAQTLSGFVPQTPMDYFYLIDSKNNQLNLKSYPGFFECREALAKTKKAESIDSFCAKSSQRIRSTESTNSGQ